jgi:hypothetical protein
MAQLYSVTSGLTAGAAAGSIKVAAHIATGSAVANRIVAFDVSFDGINAAAKPVLVELVKTTGAPSGGSTYTPNVINGQAGRTAQSTARINDTADGSSPTILAAWKVPATGGFSYQWPLGREPEMPVSAFYEIRITWAAAETVVNYLVNVWFEE